MPGRHFPDIIPPMEDNISQGALGLFDAVSAIEGAARTKGAKLSGAAICAQVAFAINRITAQRRLDAGALSLSAGLAFLSLASAGRFAFAAPKPDIALLRDFYPLLAGVEFKPFAKTIDACAAINDDPKLLGQAPVAKTTARDLWWPSLLRENRQIFIVGRMPFASNGSGGEHYILSREGKEPFGFDRSIVAFATSVQATPAWLKSALHRLNIPVFSVIDQVAVSGGAVLHLVELSHPVDSLSAPLFKMAEKLNDVAIRAAGYLGGYHLPIVEKDKIVEFKK